MTKILNRARHECILRPPAVLTDPVIIKGDVIIEGNNLNERDGLGILDTNNISIKANSQDAEVLLMEVPMSV